MATVRIRIGPLDPATNAYPLELFDDAATVAAASAALPKADVDAAPWNPQAIKNAFERPQPVRKELLDIGDRMFAWLNRGDVGTVWATRRNAGAATQIHVDVPIDFTKPPPDMPEMPWELIGAGGAPRLFQKFAAARFHGATPSPDDTAPWPLRMLVVSGAGPEDGIGADDELRALKKGLLSYRHSIDLDEFVPADPNALQTKVDNFQPHIFHFVGHSAPDAASGLPVLKFLGPKAFSLDAIQIGNLLGGWHPRLVFLNACRTAPGQAGQSKVVFGLAAAFLDNGVPAVIAMQGDIRGDMAGDFASTVYEQVWTHSVLDEAVRVARQRLYNTGNQWPLPVLSLAVPGDEVLPSARPPDGARDDAIRNCAVFQSVRLFSGRGAERRALRHAFVPVKSREARRHLVVVTGSSQFGKSHVVKWCLEELALGGSNAQYVEVGYKPMQTFVDVLVNVLDSDAKRAAEPIERKVYYRFKWDVDCIIRFGAPRPWSDEKIEGDIAFPGDQRAEDPVKAISATFIEALTEASETRPLTIVLDQFRHKNQVVVPKEIFRDSLWPYVLDPIASGKLPNVSCALVLLPEDCGPQLYGIDDFVPQAEWLRVVEFDRAAYEDLAREMLWYPTDEDAAGLGDLIAAVGRGLGSQWTPIFLKRLVDAADVLFAAGQHRARVGRSR